MAAATSSPPRRRRARDPDEDDDALEEGELRVLVHESSDSDTDTEDDDDGRRYLFQPRVEYDYASEVVRRPQNHRSPRRRPLNALDILLLGPGAGGALPSPTPSGECDSEETLSDDDHGRGGGGGNPTGSPSSSAGRPSSAAAGDAVRRGWGWAATGKRGWKGAGGNKKPAAVVLPAPAVSDLNAYAQCSHSNNTVSAAGDIQAGTTSSSAQAAPAALHQPPVPERAPQPPRARAPQPPRPRRERATEYTCKECGKSYPTNQALGGHAAGHKNKQREAEAMAAAMAAAAAGGGEGGASLAAAFPLIRRGGKADQPHECRMCGKMFATGVALGGHMRVHYTGPPIVPTRKNKKRCLAPPPPPTPAEGDIAVAAPPASAEVGLSLALSIKAEENIAAAGLSLALSIKTEEEPPSTPPAPGGGAVRVVRLFGIDISPQAQQAPAPLEQQQGSGGTTEDSSSTGQQQH
jgi:hypothetical protein